ncbi:CaiB/BaiF CoA transferase family protein, partial [Chloroflexota bacterium]
VIKVETPFKLGKSPPGSCVSPHPGDVEGQKRAAFHPLNRNKKSFALNLRSEEARYVFYRLVESVDVIVEGFSPGVTKRLGVDYETLAKINPRIVYCSLSGYGQDGPYRDLPGHDINYISIGGALGLVGDRPDSPPVIPLNFVGDYAGGALFATIGILSALLARQQTGKGQYIDTSLTDGVVSVLSMIAFDYFYNKVIPKRGESLLNGRYPHYTTYEAKDKKYISLGCMEPHFWENLCRLIGREDFIPHKYSEGEKRVEILSFLNDYFRNKTRDEWFDELKDSDIPIAKVHTVDEVFSDPQVLHRQMLAEVDHPKLGTVKQVGITIKLSDTPGKIRSTAPLHSEHTEEILQDLGYDAEQIDDLRKAGAIL